LLTHSVQISGQRYPRRDALELAARIFCEKLAVLRDDLVLFPQDQLNKPLDVGLRWTLSRVVVVSEIVVGAFHVGHDMRLPYERDSHTD
jgi:hypothetical protein